MEQIKSPELAEVMAHAERPYRDLAQRELNRGNKRIAEVALLSAETSALAEGRRYLCGLDAMLAAHENRLESPIYVGVEDLKQFAAQYGYAKGLPGKIWRSLIEAHAYEISLLDIKFVSSSGQPSKQKGTYQFELHSLDRLLDIIEKELPTKQNNYTYFSTMIGPGSGKAAYEFLWAFAKERLKDQPDRNSD